MNRLSQCGLFFAATAALSACAQAGSPAEAADDADSNALPPCESADVVDGNPCNDDDAGATCVDDPDGGYACFCSAGFKAQGQRCVDIDACSVGDSADGNPCNSNDPSATCIDEAPPSARYVCTCSPGYLAEGGGCIEIDECLMGNNPCDDAGDLAATCEDRVNDIACSCSDAVSGPRCDVFGLVGLGTPGDPYVWADGQPAVSCEEYIRPLSPRYAPSEPVVDGVYRLDPRGDGDRLEAFCDMTVDGGGWQRVVHWDRERDPATHTFQTLAAQGIDEIGVDRRSDPSPMGRVSDELDHVVWLDADFSADVLSYRFPLPAPASEVLASTHLSGASMDNSGVFLFARNEATDTNANLVCADILLSVGAYSSNEEDLFPYPCATFNPDFVHDGLFKVNMGDTPADSVILRGFMFDVQLPDGRVSDLTRLYRLDVFTRSRRTLPIP